MLKSMKMFIVSILLIFMAVSSLGALTGCSGLSERAERVKAYMPPPEIIGLMANQGMRVVLEKKDMDVEKMKAIQIIMVDAKGVLMATLKEDPGNLEAVRLEYLGTKEPELAELANTVLQLAVFWSQSMIDRGKTDMAGQYLEAAIDGAVMALNAKIGNG